MSGRPAPWYLGWQQVQRPHWKHVMADMRPNEGGSVAGASIARTRVVRGGIREVAEGESGSLSGWGCGGAGTSSL